MGSEPSFSGRIYGVWQFHNDATRTVIDALMARLQQATPELAVPHRSLAQRLEQGLPFMFPEMAGAQN
jgi:DICT domain-containing protein